MAHSPAGFRICPGGNNSWNYRRNWCFLLLKDHKQLIQFVNQIPVINADVVTGFSLCVLMIVVLGMDKETLLPLIAGHVVLEAPFVYLSVLPKLKQMDNSIYEAAKRPGSQCKGSLI